MSPYGDFSRSVRSDSEGIWFVRAVDWQAYVDAEAAYTLAAGQPPTDFSAYAGAAIGSEVCEPPDCLQVPGMWTTGTCQGSRWQLHDVESRIALSPGWIMDPRQRRTVLLEIESPELEDGGGLCSGVLISPSHILTNAHCVVDGSGNPLSLSVWSENTIISMTGGMLYSNSQVRGVSAIYLDGTSWNGTVRSDYAVVSTYTPFDNNGYMLMSNASNATLESYPTFNSGHPAWVQGDRCTAGSNRLFSHVAGAPSVVNGPNNRGTVRTELDMTVGQSGSPIYSCPAGDPNTCTGGQSGTVYGLLSHIRHSGIERFNFGPRVPGQLRAWALGVTQ